MTTQKMNRTHGVMVLAATVCGLLPGRAEAWNFVGHELSARIAWDNLSPAARREVVKIMRQHPALQTDLMRDMPKDFGDKDLYAFMVAATWPDILRDERNPLHAQHHHPLWHYINMPIILPGTDESKLVDAQRGVTAWTPGTDPANVVQALAKCVADLKDPKLPDADKAIALSWYLHLAGDIHQPLHAGTIFSDRFPSGDRGGNSSVVMSPILTTQPTLVSPDELLGANRPRRPSTSSSAPASAPTSAPTTLPGEQPINLHAYWDNLFGRFGPPRVIDALQQEITDEHPFAALRAGATTLDHVTWMEESFALAKAVVHRDGALKTESQAAMDANPATPPPALPADYLSKAQATARVRMALAGYRIAGELNEIVAAD